jgi:hypothetical protein
MALCAQVEVVDMDLQTLNAWMVMGQFGNGSMEVPRINGPAFNSTSSNATSFVVGAHCEAAAPYNDPPNAIGHTVFTSVAVQQLSGRL